MSSSNSSGAITDIDRYLINAVIKTHHCTESSSIKDLTCQGQARDTTVAMQPIQTARAALLNLPVFLVERPLEAAAAHSAHNITKNVS